MAFRDNIYGFGGVMIYKSTADLDLLLNDATAFFNSDDVVWSRYWIGSNPKNAFVEYDYESVFAYNSRTLIDYVEQTIEVYGYDDVDNAFATQRKLQNMISWAIQQSRLQDGGYLVVCPRYDFNGLSAPTMDTFYHNIFFDCEISKQYFAEDVGKSGGAEDFKLLFNVIEQKRDIDTPVRSSIFELTITSGGVVHDTQITSNGTTYDTFIKSDEE